MVKFSAHALIVASALGLSALVMQPGSAQAMTLGAPQGIRAAVMQTTATETVALVCRRVWRCGPWGCGWRRACWQTPGYGAWGYYGPRPYWGWGHRWHRRHW